MSQRQKLPPRPTLQDDREGWRAFWETQGHPWRREPEIPLYRQRVLAGRRSRVPHDPTWGLHADYPFSRFRLTRADVEWLLATHEGGCGPISSTDEGWEGRKGLDLRGADLQRVDLSGLPLANLIGGYEGKHITADQWPSLSQTVLEDDERAMASLDTAIEQGIPCALLLPLRWFKKTRPYFFDEFIRPLFLDYRLPGRDTWGQKERKKSGKTRTNQEVGKS